MRRTLSRRPAVISAVVVLLLCAARVETARRPKRGGTLRMEIAATVNSLDVDAATANIVEATAKDQLEALIFDNRNSEGQKSEDAKLGPFILAEWDPGKHALLKANPEYREGRPFVNSIPIQMGRGAGGDAFFLDARQ